MGVNSKSFVSKKNAALGPVAKGRPKGSKSLVPQSVKASLKKVLTDIATENPAMIREAIERGINAKPPYSFSYLQLAAHYIDGKPSDKIEHEGNVSFTWLTTEPTE